MRSSAFALALGGCVAASNPILTDTAPPVGLTGHVAGTARNCIAISANQGLTVLDGRTIAYHQGHTIWVNRLPAPCPGMNALAVPVVDLHGSQLCRGDRVRMLQRALTIPGPYCALGDFVPYTRG